MKPIDVLKRRNSTSQVAAWWSAIVAASSNAIVFDLSQMSSLYQDTAHATPVTAAGQTVKAIANLGFGGGYATSSTGATLQYDATHGKYYVVPPSTNGFTMTGVPAGLLGHISRSVIVTGELPGNTANYEYLFQLGVDSDGNFRHLVIGNVQSDGKFEMFSGGPGGGAAGDPIYQSGLATFIGTSVAGTTDFFRVFRAGTQLVGGSVAACNVGTGTLSLGDYTTSGAAKISKFYSLIMVDREVTTTERATAVAGAL